MFIFLRWWFLNFLWEEKYVGFYFLFDSFVGLVYLGLCYMCVEIVCMIFKGVFVYVYIVLVEIILILCNIGVKKFFIKYYNGINRMFFVF